MPRYGSSPSKSDKSRGGGERSGKANGAAAYENHRTYENVEMTQDVEAKTHHSRIAEEHLDIIKKVRVLRF